MIRLLVILFNLTAPVTALAAVQFHNFAWKADNSVVVLVAHNEMDKALSGRLKDGESRELAIDGLSVNVHSHSNSFVSLAFVEAGNSIGTVVVLERQNSQFVPLTGMISGRASTLVSDLSGSLDGMKKMNRWDHSIAFRALASYFVAHPEKSLNDFYDSVELGHVKMIAKPVPRVDAPQKKEARHSNKGPVVSQTAGVQESGEAKPKTQIKSQPTASSEGATGRQGSSQRQRENPGRQESSIIH